MTNGNGDSATEFNWVNKMSLYEQARGNENYLLHVYIVTFMAIQGVLVALLIGFWDTLLPWARFSIPVFGILFAILWAYVTESRGSKVDLWEEMLDSLWKKISESESVLPEVVKWYEGAVERRKRRKVSRLATFYGWGRCCDRFKSDRWILVMFLPSILILSWIVMTICYAITFV